IVPRMIIFRDPTRSTRRPNRGDAAAATILCKLKASEMADRLAWNSLAKAFNNTGKESTRIGGPPRKRATAAAMLIHQPYKSLPSLIPTSRQDLVLEIEEEYFRKLFSTRKTSSRMEIRYECASVIVPHLA